MSAPLRLVVLGDSVTAGSVATDLRSDELYVHHLQQELQRSVCPIELIPSALDGVDTGYALKRFDRMVAVHQPDVVCVMLGLNDFHPPGSRKPITPKQYDQNLRQLIDRIHEIRAQPILATPTPRIDQEESDANEAGFCDLMRDYVNAAMSVAENCSLRLIDAYSPFFRLGNLQRLIPDGIHPGPQGHKVIAQAFADLLIPFCNGAASQGSVA